MPVTSKPWGTTPSGEDVKLFTLQNNAGCRAHISTYGATLTGLEIPIAGKTVDVVLGFATLAEYLNDGNYLGATVGRVAGRISGSAFQLDEEQYRLDSNEDSNHLHGGPSGFNSRIWQVTAISKDQDTPSITLFHHSPHLEGGYPGNLEVEAVFTLRETGLHINYQATTDRPTPLNMTTHPYFNLNGAEGKINDHQLKIFSTKSTKFDEDLIPNGEIISVSGTEADFTDFNALGDAEQDMFFILDSPDQSRPAAIVRSAESRLEMEIRTDQRGLVLYTADYISPATAGKNGAVYGPRSGFCLESMGYPNAVNRPEFPSVILNPGERYNHSTEYRFRTL